VYRLANLIKSQSVYLVAVALLFMSSCGPSRRIRPAYEEKEVITQEKIEVEAYLFDAKLRRQGKPTSFRLEIFQTDSVMALGGRAYLGKGALKGLLTTDSLEVYFPSSNEYLYESLSDLFATAECTNTAPKLSLLHLFASLPDSLAEMEEVSVASDYTNLKHPEFVISLPDCPWVIELTYDWQETGWRIQDFMFDNGNDITLKAKRRTYKKETQVPYSKFRLVPPDGAIRITP
jgi:hypothetical protein